jgi:hypothetical protein
MFWPKLASVVIYGTFLAQTGAKKMNYDPNLVSRIGEATTPLNDMDAPLSALGILDNELLIVQDGHVVQKV